MYTDYYNVSICDMSNIEKAQSINRIIMKKVHEVCRKYDITYFLDSGALIGAIRHQSFIPWDDDVDLAFTREQYEKFMAIPKEEWGADFEVVTYQRIAPGGFFDCVTRVFYYGEEVPTHGYDKAGKKFDKKFADKVAIDCFVMDVAYDNKVLQKILMFRHMIVYGQLMGHREYIDYSEYSLTKSIVIYVLSHIGKMRSLDKLYAKYEKLCQCVKKDTKHMYYSNYPIHLMWVYLEKGWFRDKVSVQIDEDYFDAPVDYDKVLRAQYGNYMELPKEAERVPQHIIMGDEQ